MTGLKPGFSITCPRCVQSVLPGEDSCRHCGYSLAEADAHFGGGPVAVERLTDADGLLTGRERGAIGVLQREFERQFPQLFLLVYVGSLPVPSGPRQFGFWLLNQAAVPSLDVMRPNEKGLLLVVDPGSGTAALTAGYFLECYLGQEELNGVLEAGRKAFGRQQFVRGIQDIARMLTARLRQAAREAAKNPAAFKAPVPISLALGSGPFPGLTRLKEPVAVPEICPPCDIDSHAAGRDVAESGSTGLRETPEELEPSRLAAVLDSEGLKSGSEGGIEK